MRVLVSAFKLLVVAAFAVPAHALADTASCAIAPGIVTAIQKQLNIVVNLSDHNGSLVGAPNTMWSAIVDRAGVLCSLIKTGDAWPGSRAIAIAKAETANDFSNDRLALSTANLYAPTQPGGSLYGLNNSNTFNPLPCHWAQELVRSLAASSPSVVVWLCTPTARSSAALV